MTRAKELLEQATPLPWAAPYGPSTTHLGQRWTVRGPEWFVGEINSDADAALIVYAVNRLPDHVAAVEALERLLELVEKAGDEYAAHSGSAMPAMERLQRAVRTVQTACDGCTQGVMDGGNDHLHGRCSHDCHRFEARAALRRLRDEVPA